MSTFAYNPDLDRTAKSWSVQLKAFYQKIFKEAGLKAKDEVITGDWEFVEKLALKENSIITSEIAEDAITDSKLRDSTALSVIGRASNTTGDPADIVAGSDHQVLRRSGTTVGFGAINLGSTNAVSGVLPVANGGTGKSTYAVPETLFSIGQTLSNTASAVSYTAGNIGTVPVNYFTKAGDAIHLRFKNYFGANTGTGRAMLFRIDPSTDADVDFYSTGSVGWTGEVVDVDVILYRRTLTEMRIEWSVKSTTSVNTNGRAAMAVTTYNQTFNCRCYIRGSVAGEVQSEYLSGIGIRTV